MKYISFDSKTIYLSENLPLVKKSKTYKSFLKNFTRYKTYMNVVYFKLSLLSLKYFIYIKLISLENIITEKELKNYLKKLHLALLDDNNNTFLRKKPTIEFINSLSKTKIVIYFTKEYQFNSTIFNYNLNFYDALDWFKYYNVKTIKMTDLDLNNDSFFNNNFIKTSKSQVNYLNRNKINNLQINKLKISLDLVTNDYLKIGVTNLTITPAIEFFITNYCETDLDGEYISYIKIYYDVLKYLILKYNSLFLVYEQTFFTIKTEIHYYFNIIKKILTLKYYINEVFDPNLFNDVHYNNFFEKYIRPNSFLFHYDVLEDNYIRKFLIPTLKINQIINTDIGKFKITELVDEINCIYFAFKNDRKYFCLLNNLNKSYYIVNNNKYIKVR